MSRPYALLRAGFPYLTTIGVRRNQNVTHPTDITFGKSFLLIWLDENCSFPELRKKLIGSDNKVH